MNFEQEKRIILKHPLASDKLKILVKLFDREVPKDAVSDLIYALQLFQKKAREDAKQLYY